MRADLATYLAGFDKISAAVRSGDITTPQAANGVIGAFKDAVRRLEATSDAIGGASDIKMGKRIALLEEDTAHTNNEMSIIAALAIVVAILIGFRLREAIQGSAS
jgi:methyl-accepting chemotaxis protein